MSLTIFRTELFGSPLVWVKKCICRVWGLKTIKPAPSVPISILELETATIERTGYFTSILWLCNVFGLSLINLVKFPNQRLPWASSVIETIPLILASTKSNWSIASLYRYSPSSSGEAAHKIPSLLRNNTQIFFWMILYFKLKSRYLLKLCVCSLKRHTPPP